MSIASLISNAVFLSFVVGIPLIAAFRGVVVFDAFIEGAKEGVYTTVRIIPHLVGLLVAIGMLRASGFFDVISRGLSPVLTRIGVPADILPFAFIRPFSGSAANGVMADIIHQHGGDAFISKLTATMMGSTETTFYVIAVYFGAVGIRKTRYAIPVGLTADIAGMIASVIVCRWLFLS